jgi:hypothetical protein
MASQAQMKAAAQLCSKYSPISKNLQELTATVANIDEPRCDMCEFWKSGDCDIFDEIITSMDQT